MGAVYLAHDTQLDRPVALKMPRFTDGPQALERFHCRPAPPPHWPTPTCAWCTSRPGRGHQRPDHDGRRLLSGGLDDTVRLWEVETGRELQVCKGHTLVVHRVLLIHDGRHTLSASGNHTLWRWKLAR
jgi:hypothetical protein